MTSSVPVYIKSLTPLRGVAALWVVLFHIDVSIFYRDLGGLLPRHATGILSKGYLWVDFFFLLSGFIIAHVYGDLLSEGFNLSNIRKFLWARFSRIYPLHIFTTLLLVVAVLVVPALSPTVVDGSWETYFNWSMLPGHFILTNAMTNYHALTWNMTSWSIGAEWWTYVMALALFPIFYNRSRLLTFLFITLFFLLLVGLVDWHPGKNLDITWDWGVLRCLFEFSIGLGIHTLYNEKLGVKLLSQDITTILLFAFTAFVFHFELNDLLVIPVFGLMILAVAYNEAHVKRILEKPVFKYLGDISYSIYLVHSLWFMVFWYSFPHWKVHFDLDTLPIWQRIIYTIIFLVLTIISSHFTYIYVELKARNFLKSFQAKKPSFYRE